MKFQLVVCFASIYFYNIASSVELESLGLQKTSVGLNSEVFNQVQDVEDAEFWRESAQEALRKKVESQAIMEREAKNVIFYLGDGMSVTTITAARILKGQKVDNLPFGEEAELYWETFPYTAVSKTYCSNSQIADSACTATAYLCGSKGNIGTIGVTPNVQRKNCTAQANTDNHVSSVLAWAQAAGKSTGIVVRSKVTDASPSGTYAHVADRDWENDSEVRKIGEDPNVCVDIAKQLILGDVGSKIDVILGGGRLQFLKNTTADPESPEQMGYRSDGLDLIETWKSSKNDNNKNSAYITSKDQLLQVNTKEMDFLLGLFAPGDMSFLDEQDKNDDPSLEDMTRVAIEILSKNPNGFFLFVEGSNIDSAHHENWVQRALWETIELDKAVKKGDDMTDDKDTLLLVTSDHAHVLTFAADAVRGQPILGIAQLGSDDLPYSTLGYANGPSTGFWNVETGTRQNITENNFEARDYRVPSPVPRGSETHGGDDVLIISKGPYSHFLTGYQEQSYIPHVIGFAACIGNGAQHCKQEPTTKQESTDTTTDAGSSSAGFTTYNISFILFFVLFLVSKSRF